MATEKRILVTGATGQQGGAVSRALLAKGLRVRGMTRKLDSPAAEALRAAGAEMVQADLADVGSVAQAASGVDAIFAMTTPFEAGEEAEVAQGRAIVDAALAAGVDYLVYSSVASADRETGIPHFESKWEVEKYLAASGLDWSVVAPVYFMENLFFPDSVEALAAGTYPVALPPDLPLQQVAVEDIGAFGAMVVDQKAEFVGRRTDIAGDELTSAESAEALSRVLGRPVQHYEVPIEQIRAFSEDLAAMYEWFIETGYRADIDTLRSAFPMVGWQRFEDWAGARVPGVVSVA